MGNAGYGNHTEDTKQDVESKRLDPHGDGPQGGGAPEPADTEDGSAEDGSAQDGSDGGSEPGQESAEGESREPAPVGARAPAEQSPAAAGCISMVLRSGTSFTRKTVISVSTAAAAAMRNSSPRRPSGWSAPCCPRWPPSGRSPSGWTRR